MRNVLLVAATRSGRPSPRSFLAAGVSSSAACASSCARAARSGRPPSRASGRNRRVIRPAPRGSERATSGSSSTPPASSRDPPPMSSTSSFPALQPNHRRTARKVSRASSSPLSTCRSTPVRSRIRSSTSSPLAASRIADVTRAMSSSQPCFSAWWQASWTARSSAFSPAFDSRPSSPICSARRSSQRSSCVGVGCAPRWASTTIRWTVFDPTSSTPSRMAPVCLAPPEGAVAPLRGPAASLRAVGGSGALLLGWARAGRPARGGTPRLRP